MLFKIRVATAMMCIVVLFPLTLHAKTVAITNLPKEAIKPLYQAQQAFKEKNYPETIRVLTEYMGGAKETIPLPAFQMLGHAYYQNNDKNNAQKTYAKGHKAFPQNPEMLQNYAILAYEIGNYRNAGHLFETLYKLKGEADSKILYQAAGLYFQAEDMTNAKRVLGRLLSRGGKLNPKWYEDMIALCVGQKSWKEAEKWATQLLSKEPEHPEYWRLLAQIRLDREEYRQGAAALEIAYRLEKPKAFELLELSQLYLYLNAPLMAVRCMNQAYNANPPDQEIIKISEIYAKTLRYTDALKYLDQAIAKHPSASLYYEKGQLFYNALKYRQAITALNTCTKLDPGFSRAYILKGFSAWNLKQWDASRSFFAKASTFPTCSTQANEAVLVLDDLIAALEEK